MLVICLSYYAVTFVCAGDVNSISIGSGTNIQDNSLVHVAKTNLAGKVLPTIIGDNVTVGELVYVIDLRWIFIFWFRRILILMFSCEQVIVLFCMDVLLRMRHLLVWVLPCLMEFMLRNMPWLLLELL